MEHLLLPYASLIMLEVFERAQYHSQFKINTKRDPLSPEMIYRKHENINCVIEDHKTISPQTLSSWLNYPL